MPATISRWRHAQPVDLADPGAHAGVDRTQRAVLAIAFVQPALGVDADAVTALAIQAVGADLADIAGAQHGIAAGVDLDVGERMPAVARLGQQGP